MFTPLQSLFFQKFEIFSEFLRRRQFRHIMHECALSRDKMREETVGQRKRERGGIGRRVRGNVEGGGAREGAY